MTDDKRLRAAAEQVDRAWFAIDEGDTVRMRYSSLLPRFLNELRAALAASATDEPYEDPEETQ